MSPAWDDEKRRLAAAMRSNPTTAEAALWERLRRRPGGFTFWNQHEIRGWIADFYCPAARLVIEVDGSSHRGREAQDQLRDEVMRTHHFGVLRFSNAEVHRDASRPRRRSWRVRGLLELGEGHAGAVDPAIWPGSVLCGRAASILP